MKKPEKIGLLCTLDAPLLTQCLQSIYSKGYEDIYLIADLKGYGAKNHERWLKRTAGFFETSTLKLGDFIERKLAIYLVNSHNNEGCISLISGFDTSLLVNVGTPRKLSRIFLDSIGCDILNIHPGVLPKYRGSSCVEWAILNDDPIGNSAHFMTEDYDVGPIIRVEEYQFRSGVTYADIRNRVYQESIKFMVDTIEIIFNQDLSSPSLPKQDSSFQAFEPISDFEMSLVKQKIATHDHPSIGL